MNQDIYKRFFYLDPIHRSWINTNGCSFFHILHNISNILQPQRGQQSRVPLRFSNITMCCSTMHQFAFSSNFRICLKYYTCSVEMPLILFHLLYLLFQRPAEINICDNFWINLSNNTLSLLSIINIS